MKKKITSYPAKVMKDNKIMLWLILCYQIWKFRKNIEIFRKSSITIKNTDTVIEHLPIKKTPVTDGFIGIYYQICREKIVLIFCKLFQKIEKERTFPTVFCEFNITLVTTRKELYEKGKLQANLTYECRFKNP